MAEGPTMGHPRPTRTRYHHKSVAYGGPSTMSALLEHMKPDASASSGRGVVLFADDEAILCEVASVGLARAGYEVLIAQGGDIAARMVEEDGARLALAIIDWSMPGLSGGELLARIRARRPTLPIIVSSGDTEGELRSLESSHASLRILPKPWRMRALIELVGSLTPPSP